MFKLAGWLRAIAVTAVLAMASAASAAPSVDVRAAAASAARAPLDQLVAEVETQHPVAMFILAKCLFDEGRRDEAVFWFYQGQLRWRARLIGDPSLNEHISILDESEGERFGRLMASLGPDINGYAGADVPALLKTYEAVLAWDLAHADPFSISPQSKQESREGLGKLAAYVEEHRAEMAERAKANPRGPTPGTAEAYAVSGDAAGGALPETMRDYDPATFGAIRPGAGRAQVIAAVGRPDSWSVEPNGTSVFRYSVVDRAQALPGMGLAKVEQVAVAFDKDQRVTRVDLPGR